MERAMTCNCSLTVSSHIPPSLKLLEADGLPQPHPSGFLLRDATFRSHQSFQRRALIIGDSLKHKNLRTKGDNTDLREDNGNLNA